MIRAHLRMRVKPGKERAFEKAWWKVALATSYNPGNLGQALLRDTEPSSFVITSDWISVEAFRAFERSPEQDALTAPLRDLRESAEMCVYEIVHHVEPWRGS
ncbi:antibiotic biosynthesis monooxygenase family protein [Nonomuraea sp. CA-141351]|uniref:antibiotic biosynthesis monooxygenase family protein n=1 Tax=Nonomuraea sp. CA-141351 TaxID=3239996 RepID=UPI003D8F726A